MTFARFGVGSNARRREKMVKTPTPIRGRGPAISALDPWTSSAGRMHQLLTDDQRAQLALMSSIVRFKKREIIYRERDPGEAVFAINTGVVAAYKEAPDGREHIAAFLFADDLFGLSAEGKYTNLDQGDNRRERVSSSA